MKEQIKKNVESETQRFRTQFSKHDSKKYATVNKKPSLTQQNFKDECDINKIINRYEKTGVLPESTKIPQYLDCSEIPSYDQALQLINDAEQSFMQLDAQVRKKFENDPGKFYNFVTQEATHEELVELGLAVERQAEVEQTNVSELADSASGEAAR